MKHIDADKLKAEIERRIKAIQNAPSDGGVMDAILGARGHELITLLVFLDTLEAEQPVPTIMTNEMLMGEIKPEQPVIKKSNALFDKCVENCDPAVMKEVSDNIDKMLGRQPVEGLEEAATEFANQDCVTFISRRKGFIAGAKWMAEQINKK